MPYLSLAGRDCVPPAENTPLGWWANVYNKELALRNAARYIYYKGGISFDCFIFPYLDRLSLLPGHNGPAPATGNTGGVLCAYLPPQRQKWAMDALALLPDKSVTVSVSETRPVPDAIPQTADLIHFPCDTELCLRDSFGSPECSCFAPGKQLHLRPGVPIGRYRISSPSPLALPDDRDSSVRLAYRRLNSVCETSARIARSFGALIVRDRCDSFSLLVQEADASALLERLRAFSPFTIEREQIYML